MLATAQVFPTTYTSGFIFKKKNIHQGQCFDVKKKA